MSNEPRLVYVKARVAVAGLSVGQAGPLREGYAKTLIKAGYVEPLDSLQGVMLANPVLYGEWEVDPRTSEET
mgnify:CR=1 FL=1